MGCNGNKSKQPLITSLKPGENRRTQTETKSIKQPAQLLLRNVKVIKDKDRLRTDWGRLTRRDSYMGNPGLVPGRKKRKQEGGKLEEQIRD